MSHSSRKRPHVTNEGRLGRFFFCYVLIRGSKASNPDKHLAVGDPGESLDRGPNRSRLSARDPNPSARANTCLVAFTEWSVSANGGSSNANVAKLHSEGHLEERRRCKKVRTARLSTIVGAKKTAS